MATRKSESMEVAHVRTDELNLEKIDLASQESVTFATTVTSDSTNGDSKAASSSSVFETANQAENDNCTEVCSPMGNLTLKIFETRCELLIDLFTQICPWDLMKNPDNL